MRYPFKPSLNFFANLPIMHRIEQPKTVYHMTARANIQSILNDGFIHTGGDVCCWFFSNLCDIPLYLAITHAETAGRMYWDYDGKLHKAAPTERNDTVVLKLKPRYSEPDKWFIEINEINRQEEAPGTTLEDARQVLAVFNCRLTHYGKFKFNTLPGNIETIELEDVFNMEFDYSDFETGLLEKAKKEYVSQKD